MAASERVDWNQQFRDEIIAYEKEMNLSIITDMENEALAKGEAKGREEGRVEGLVEGLLESIEGMLELRFGAKGLELLPALRNVGDVGALRAFLKVLRWGATGDMERAVLPE